MFLLFFLGHSACRVGCTALACVCTGVCKLVTACAAHDDLYSRGRVCVRVQRADAASALNMCNEYMWAEQSSNFMLCLMSYASACPNTFIYMMNVVPAIPGRYRGCCENFHTRIISNLSTSFSYFNIICSLKKQKPVMRSSALLSPSFPWIAGGGRLLHVARLYARLSTVWPATENRALSGRRMTSYTFFHVRSHTESTGFFFLPFCQTPIETSRWLM